MCPDLRRLLPFFLLLLFSFRGVMEAKDPPMILKWPKDKPVIQATFGKINGMGRYGTETRYVVEVLVENLTEKPFPSTQVPLLFFSKDKVQVGIGQIHIYPQLAPRAKAKQQVQFSAIGVPTMIAMANPDDIGLSADHTNLGKLIGIAIHSVPAGAMIEVDGKAFGVTPKVLRFPVGPHTLVLTKLGFSKATYPFDVLEDDGRGGLIEVELPLSNDLLEMRDGSAIGGDVMALDGNWVTIITNGETKKIDRNQVKRMTLLERLKPDTGSAPAN